MVGLIGVLASSRQPTTLDTLTWDAGRLADIKRPDGSPVIAAGDVVTAWSAVEGNSVRFTSIGSATATLVVTPDNRYGVRTPLNNRLVSGGSANPLWVNTMISFVFTADSGDLMLSRMDSPPAGPIFNMWVERASWPSTDTFGGGGGWSAAYVDARVGAVAYIGRFGFGPALGQRTVLVMCWSPNQDGVNSSLVSMYRSLTSPRIDSFIPEVVAGTSKKIVLPDTNSNVIVHELSVRPFMAPRNFIEMVSQYQTLCTKWGVAP